MAGRRKPELLIPAGSLEVLRTAVIFGADAVYIGGEAFGLRAKAKNFSPEEMAEGIAFAHARGVKVYVTANILAHNYDLEGAGRYFQELKALRPDALIIADPGMFMLAREICPEIDIHISTQANNTNYRTYRFWWELGARRVVSARELSLAEIIDELNTIIRPQAREKDQTFEIHATALTCEHLLGDKLRINQIMINILSNAVKYSAGDLSVSLEADGTLTFSNTAPGMTALLAQKLFDRYFTVQTGRQATGLGLSIARQLTEAMGGSVEAQCQGEVLTVTVRFP